jgi:hypothetical protein
VLLLIGGYGWYCNSLSLVVPYTVPDYDDIEVIGSGNQRTVRVFRQNLAPEDAIGSHACSLEANMRVSNGIPLGCTLPLPVAGKTRKAATNWKRCTLLRG